MAKARRKLLSTYSFPFILISSIFLGGFAGYCFGQDAIRLKPFGDIFLNLIFTTIVPLIFFSVSSAIARSSSLEKLGKILSSMMLVFIFTGTIAALYTIGVVTLFPVGQNINLPLAIPETVTAIDLPSQIVNIFTVPDFASLLSQNHILALIVFSMLIGIATLTAGETGKPFANFLQSGEIIFMRVFKLIMFYAPIGFFCYFAVMVSQLGPQLLQSYAQIALLYYSSALIYFIAAFTFYAYLSGKLEGVKLFWKNAFLPTVTSIATCSSIASIPANLAATKEMKVSPEIYETTIPLGAMIHKDGSVMGGIFKIAFLFGIFHLSFSGIPVILTALGVALLVGTVMGAIPSGGMLGELLILNVYGFPPNALIAAAAISIIIDPPATLLNVTGDGVASMLVARLVEGRKWFKQ